MTLVCELETEQRKQNTNAERRRGFRIRQQRSAKIYDPVGNRYFGAQTRDISATGLCLELPRVSHLQAGNVVCVHVGVGENGLALANRRSMIPARIIWVDRGIQGTAGRFNVGVEFMASIAAHSHAA